MPYFNGLWILAVLATVVHCENSDFGWVTVPGNVNALVGPNVTFHWIHSGHGDVESQWSYLGAPPNKTRSLIMLKTSHGVYGYETIGQRLEYVDFEGSATVQLIEATPSDAGIFEAKSILHRDYICNETLLTLYTVSDLSYTVYIDGQVFDLSIGNNGSWISLNDPQRPLPNTFNVTTVIDETAPNTTITVSKEVGHRHWNASPCHTHQCIRFVTFNEEDAKHHTGEIFRGTLMISIHFHIQHLPDVNVTMEITHSAHESSYRRIEHLVIGVIGLACLGCFFTVIWFWVKKKEQPEVKISRHSDSSSIFGSHNTKCALQKKTTGSTFQMEILARIANIESLMQMASNHPTPREESTVDIRPDNNNATYESHHV